MLRLLARLHNVREAAWAALREDCSRRSRGSSSDMCAGGGRVCTALERVPSARNVGITRERPGHDR